MLVKRYVVKEMPEAVAMIREDLGIDAVILSTKKVQKRGFLGLFPKTHIEVIAAANEQEPPAELTPQTYQARPSAANAYQRQMGQQAAEPAPPAPLHAPAATPAPASAPTPAPPPVAPAPVREPAPSPTAAPAPQEGEQVLKEVQELRTMFRSLLNSSYNQLMPAAVVNVRKQLLKGDISEEAVDQLIERGIRNIDGVHDINEQEFRGILTNFIREDLDRYSPPSQIALKSRVVAFIGPTGVGKTTTIAKLAAEQVLSRGKKVGLITTDTYRIAAVEQLRTYANILGIPLEVCYAPEDIKRAMGAYADYDLILIDTAGRNYHNLLNVRQLNTYLEEIQPDETYLVLSLTTKASDLEEIAGNFTQVRADKFLFTKSDETKTYGAVYNLVTRFQKPLSYLTTGQNVPEDIETVSTERLAKMLTGDQSYE
ncbi:flagellar biosynthesis protein FlhF [Tumebacillus sp. BK434]|uniref:flagellar biosynthesis protein FlhF n=1 Tax=Tumebacillus sp. BK434 TaxID=2512169 RepID=UPI00104DDA2F|nr:flagellar biosynthesis protein FlhF [Tumebacillus sp. BK434]TCP58838.1 flagellar biosynthesis protein FlhF [Tumebacillus sp. BK434]